MALYHIRPARGTAAAWTSANPVLKLGELGIETDTNRMKIGDGASAWTGLQYVMLKQQAPNIYTVSTVATLVDSATFVSAVALNSASACTFTIPQNVFPVGDCVNLIRYGSGAASFVAGSGVTLQTAVGLNLRSQYSWGTALQIAANVWVAGGDLQ
jgi:hypothetical protein